MRLHKIAPSMFTQSEWEELFNATRLVDDESIYQAKAVRRTEKSIRDAIQRLNIRRNEIRTGPLGPDRSWCRDLKGAAEVLKRLLEEKGDQK